MRRKLEAKNLLLSYFQLANIISFLGNVKIFLLILFLLVKELKVIVFICLKCVFLLLTFITYLFECTIAQIILNLSLKKKKRVQYFDKKYSLFM